MKLSSRRQRRQGIFFGLACFLTASLLLLLFLPVSHPPFVHSPPPPPDSYEQTVAEIRAEIAATPDSISPEGRVILLEHGHPTERVFVLMHGLSNAPAQFSKLGELLYAQGDNVFIPRLPAHGERDLMSEDFGRLTATGMLAASNDAVDQARGLGKKVIFVGLSISGTTAAWMAQNRSDLHRAVLLSPFLAPALVPGGLAVPTENLLLRIPNFFIWWNPKLKEANPGPKYAYPRFPTRLIGETMLLGRDVLRASRKNAPLCQSILVVTSESDLAANNGVTATLVENWRSHQAADLQTHAFPKKEKVPHDFIDPHQPDERVDLVYPQLLQWLTNEG